MKKGMSTMAIVILALTLVIGSVLLVFAYNLGLFAGDLARKEACAQSVRAHAFLHMRGEDFSDTVKCPTEYITLDAGDPEKIKWRLATSLLDTSDVFLKGKEELFADDATYCAIYDVFSFTGEGEIADFSKFLIDEGPRGNKISFADDLQGYQTPRAKEVISTLSPDEIKLVESGTPIDLSKRYATVFLYAKGEDEIRNLLIHLDTQKYTLIAGGGVIAGGIYAGLVFSGPVGWAIGAVGVTVIGAGYAYDKLFGTATPPEWISMTLLREYDEEALRGIGCRILPVET
ncbi:MAG: hypothetical protein ABH879_09325 [archaeon]